MSEDGGLNCNSISCGSLLTAPVALDTSGHRSSEISSEASSEGEESHQTSSDPKRASEIKVKT